MIALYYKYVYLPDPEGIARWQRKLCSELNLTGRIIIAQEGINGTVGGDDSAVETYITAMRENPAFADVDFKTSPGDASCFPRMRIVVKNEVVSLGIDPEKIHAKDGGIHLSPEEAHTLISEKPENLVILDGRNQCESAIGRFEGAITPEIKHFREFPQFIDKNVDSFKDKQVLMYCTGGIRCERASAYLKSKGVAQEVFQITGGIQRYTEQFPDGHFKGKNYVFDSRIAVKISDDILGTCYVCNAPSDEYINCLIASCNRHYIGCVACVKTLENCCSEACYQLKTKGTAPLRPHFQKHISAL